MTLKPQLPSIDQQVADLLQRVGILEALNPDNALIITDGSVTVDPTVEIDVDPASLLLTDLGGGVAELSAGIPGLWTPALHQSTTDPTGAYTTAGQYVRVGNLVFVCGDISFGAGFGNGTGNWTLSLPFASAALYSPAGVAILEGFGHDHSMSFLCGANIDTGSTSELSFQYFDALPVSTRNTFDGTAWTGAAGFTNWNGDTFGFTAVYYTNDP